MRLTSFDIPLVGLTAIPDPLTPTVPKNTASAVRIVVHSGDTTLSSADAATYFGAGFQVRAELAGPGLDRPITIPQLGPSDPAPADPLLLQFPPLPLGGDYTISNIRILHADGSPLLDVAPSSIPLKVIDQVLVTSVTTRPLTLVEIQAAGIVLDSNAYLGFQFTLGLETETQSVQFTVPVVFNQQGVPVPQVISAPPAPPRNGVAVSDAPDPLIVPALLNVDPTAVADIPDIQSILKTPAGDPIRIPSILVIPGNVGYLKQFFSAQLIVANGTPVGSGLNVDNVTGTVHLPPGPDLVPGTADDPLSLPATTRGPQSPTLPVRGVGPDGIPGTADDVALLKSAEQGQAEFLIRGDQEGYYDLSFDINATLEGLPIGPIPVTGTAKGGVLVRNPFFNMTFTIPSTVRKGETFSIFATVANISQSVANDVHVTLDGSRTSGATLVGDATQSIPTINPRDARTVEFKFISAITGQTSATYLNFDTSGSGGGNLKFSLGVGERGVALSPDTLVLPAAVDGLPPDVVSAAMRVLGQAWSISNAPTGTLPADVIRTSRTVTTQKALALSEAGMRVSLGQPAEGAVRDLAFDFWGGMPLDPGFDQLLRQTNAGQDLARAIGAVLAPPMTAAGGLLPYARASDTVAISGSDYIGIAIGQGSAAAPVTASLIDPAGPETDASTSLTDLPRAEIPGAVWVPLGPTASEPLLGILTAPSAPSYTLQLTGTASGSVDLAITQPIGDGTFVRGSVTGLAVSAGSHARVMIDRRQPQTLVVQIDADGDGVFEGSQTMATERLTSPGPTLISATVVGPETLDGASPFGFEVAALFDRIVDPTSAALPGNYVIAKNSVQSANRQLSGRFVFASLNQPEGPYIPTTLAVSNISDARGAVGPATTVPLASRLEDPGAVVSGHVVGADGQPVTSGVVTYINNAAWTCPEDPGDATHSGFAAVPLDPQGRYEFRYVRQDKCGYPWAMAVSDPKTGALRQVTGFVRAAGEQIVLDMALVGQGVVTGVARDLSGAPVPGAQVVVVSVTDPQVGGAATTDGDGRYTVYGITVGEVSVQAAKGSGAGQASGNIARAGGTASIDVTLDSGAASVAGAVFVQQGTTTSAVPGIQVVFESGGLAVAVSQTDATGAFAFASVPIGPYRITAAMNTRDQAAVTGVVAAGDALQNVDLVITLPDPTGAASAGNQGFGTVSGTVRYPDGTVAPGVIVAIRNRGVLTDDNGAFEIPGVPVQNGVQQSVTAESRDGLRTGAAVAVVNVPGQIVSGVSIALSGLGTVEFTVLGPTGAPIAGQDVGLVDRCESACGCDPQTTGADGKVHWEGLPLGTVNVSAVRSGAGFVDVARGSASITRDGELATGTLQFAGSGVVSGTVRDSKGQPVFGADVTLQSLTFDPASCGLGGGVTQRVQTNTLGAYRFVDVNVGAVSVSASQAFFPTPVGKSGALTQQGQEVVLDMVLSSAASTIAGVLSGTISLPDGIMPAGAGVEITATGSLPDVVVDTDAQGHYAFAKIFPEGTWTLTVRDPITGGVARSSIYLRAGQDQTADLRLLGRGTVVVNVLDAGGTPVSDAFVRLTESGFPNETFEGAIDKAHLGVVTFANVFEGVLSAQASDAFARGGRASSVLVGPGATLEMVVSLSLTGRVTGIFVGPDGTTPIPFGAVSLTAGGRTIGQTTTEGSGPDVGKFSFDYVPGGPVRVDAQDPATARTGFAVGTIAAQDQDVDLLVRAQGLGTVTGVVTSNGAPQPGADLQLVVGGFRAASSTDAQGRYIVGGVPEGQVVATASLGGGFLGGTASANLVGDGTTLELDVALRGSGKVTGHVVKADGVTPANPSSVSIQVGGSGGGSSTTVSDAQGFFEFDRVPAGLATLTADVLGSVDHGALTAEVPAAGTADVTITLHGVGVIRGIAQDSTGQPTAGTVAIYGASTNPYTLTASVGADGAFFFPEVLAGDFSVSLTVPASTFTLYGAAAGTVTPDHETPVTVRVQPSGVVAGKVVRSNGSTPAPGAEVTLQLLPDRGALVLYTRDDGTFEVPGVPLGSLSLSVRDPFSTGVALVSGQALSTNGERRDVGTIVLDDTPVTVVSISPADGSVQVPVDQFVQVVFTDPLASAAGVEIGDGTRTLSANATLSPDRLTVTLQGFWPDSRDIVVTATTNVTDVYGRRLAQPVTSHFHTVDLTPPSVASLVPPDGAIEVLADEGVVVTFDEPLSDGASVASVVALASPSGSVAGTSTRTSPTTVTFVPSAPLANDTLYTVTVNGATDVSGNVQTTAFHSKFATHDTQPPSLALSAPPPDTWTNQARPTVVIAVSDSLSGIDAATETLAIDGVAVTPTQSESVLSYLPTAALADGAHTLEASVGDRAGNVESLSSELRIDTVPPSAAQITGVAANAVLVGTVPIGAAATDLGSGVQLVQVLCDGALVLTLSGAGLEGSLDSSTLSEGPHALTARAVDVAGNVGPGGAPIHVIVNNLPVAVAITTPAAGAPFRDAVHVMATVSEPVASVAFSVGGSTVTDSAPPYDADLSLAALPEGPTTIVVTATGLLGETATATRDIVVDRTPPAAPDVTLVFAEPPDNGQSLVYGQTGAVEGGARVNLTNVATSTSATALAAADGGFSTYVAASVGDTVSLVAVDPAGNVSPPVTIVVRSTTTLPAAVATLVYDGAILDRVGPGVGALTPDGEPDGVFELSFSLGTGITRSLAFIDLQGPASARSTRPDVGAGLGVSSGQDLGAPLFNHIDGTVDASLTADVSLLLFASPSGFIQPGASYTVTAVFTNGSRYIGAVTIPETSGNEVASSAVSVDNSSPAFDPDAVAVTGEVASLPVSVDNMSLPFDVSDPTIAEGPPEVASLDVSIDNNAPPAYANDLSGPTELASLTVSVDNMSLPFGPSDLVGPTELASLPMSVNNDPTLNTRVGSQYNPGVSCARILTLGGSVGDGSYWVKPATGSAFQVACDMTTLGGGWTQLGGAFADGLDGTASKQYLYRYGGRWYLSPATTINWSWSTGQELAGTYSYSLAGADGGAGSFSCTGSVEKPLLGLGCSNGLGAVDKVIPSQPADSVGGTCEVCQGPANVFTGSSCQTQVAIFVRSIEEFPPDGGVSDAGARDAGAADHAVDVPDASGCVTPPSELFAWWRGDGNAKDSAGLNDGTLLNGTSFAAGEVGQAFAINGGVVDMGHAVVATTGPFTIEGWIRTDALGNYQAIVSEIGSENTTGQFQFRVNPTGGLQFFRRATTGTAVRFLETTEHVQAGTWTHVAAIFGGGDDLEIFINGAPTTGAVQASSYSDGAAGTTKIGSSSSVAGGYELSGLVDELSVYTRALSAQEIQAIAAAGGAGKCK